MNKELKELFDKINEKKAEVKNLVAENKVEEAKASKEELINLQAKFDVLYDLEMEEKEEIKDKVEVKEMKEISNKVKVDSVKEFANAVKGGFKNAMTEGVQTDGGYTVPVDIQTQIEKFRDAEFSLRELVRVVPVSTLSGARTFQSKADQTGFNLVGENGKIGASAEPKFERIEYSVKKYAGYLPVTNELLADSDANITSVITEWLGGESRATANKLILEAITTAKAQSEDLKNVDGIKNALNVTLGQAYKSTSKIITNDSGLQYLDTYKDSVGNYILQPNPADPMQLRLCAGATVIPVVVVPNSVLPNGGADKKEVPFIIGDLNEGIVLWDRQQISISSSNMASIGGVSAFENDLTLFRAIEREDVTVRDANAFVRGHIKIK